MEFRDLKKQYRNNRGRIDRAVSEVLSEGAFISGRQVEELEETLAEYTGVKHCITCANGTDALQLSLMAWGIGKGDAVFVPDFTFFASAEVVSLVGADPVFVDVEADTFNISADSLKAAVEVVIRRGTAIPKAVIAVDLFGQPADYQAIRAVTDQYGLLLLEDGAQGFGGSIRTRRACSFGDISTTSFFPAKPLGCYGDGGAIFTDSDEHAATLRSLRVHGKGEDKYDNVRIGLNSRLDTLQAAVLMEKIRIFDSYELEAVNAVAKEYDKRLRGVVETPMIKVGYQSSWAQYTILMKDVILRDGLQDFLKERQIPSMIYYKKAMHEQKAFAGQKDEVPLNCSESLCKRVLSIPMHPYLTQEDIEEVTAAIIEYTGSSVLY